MMITTMIERAAAAVTSASLKSLLILAIAGLIVSLWRKSSAASRHLVWTAAVAATITLPLVGALMPAWTPAIISFQIPQAFVATRQAEAAPRATITERPTPTEPTDIILAASKGSRATAQSESSPGPRSTASQRPQTSRETAPSGKSFVVSSAASSGGHLPTPETPRADAQASVAATSIRFDPPHALSTASWSQIATTIWLIGFFLVLLPFFAARLRLRRIASTASVITEGRWITMLGRIRSTGEFTRHVTLLESDDATMPMTWGLISPVLLLPSNTAEWSDWECRNILLHELAHIDRLDCLTQMIAQAACALYWFNPLCWVAARRMCVERELACDDRVIGMGSRPSDYAGQLLDVARSLRPARATAHAAIAMARPSQLSGRLTAVLDRERNRQTVSKAFRATVAVMTLAVLLPLASLTPWVNKAGAAPTRSVERTAYGALPNARENAAALEHGSVVTLLPLDATGERAAGVRSREMGDLKPLNIAAAFSAPVSGFLPIIKAVQSSDGALGLVREPAAAAQGTSCWDTKNDHATSISSHDDGSGTKRISVKFSNGSCTLDLQADGDFTLRPDLSDVATLERGGTLTLEERDGSSTRRIEIRNNGNGLEHLYFVNGRAADYSPEARAWLATTLLAVERRTAFAAKTRVPQIFESRGARGVLDEVSLMPSDYAKSAYLTVLLKQGISLDAPTLTRIVQQSAREMTSDYYLAEVFKQVGTQRLADEGTWRAFADAAVAMKSDYYKSMVISSVLARDRLDQGTVSTLLKAASTIGSDYYQAETLKSMSKKYAITAQSRPYYLAALGRIGSDYYKYEVLSFLNTNEAIDAPTVAAILKSVGDMTSDYYKSEALSMLSRRRRLDAATRSDYLAALRSITSDYYKHQVLNGLLAERPLTRETVAGILAVAPSIKSDYELSTLLSSVAGAFPIDETLRPAYDRAVDSIKSDYYRNAAAGARASTR